MALYSAGISLGQISILTIRTVSNAIAFNKLPIYCTSVCVYIYIYMIFSFMQKDPSVLSNSLLGHTDAVWGLSLHSQKLHLLSSSADGSVRLWNPQSKSPLLSVFTSESGAINRKKRSPTTSFNIIFAFWGLIDRWNTNVSGFCS